MTKFLFPLFILVPIIELQLLLLVHEKIGFLNTLALVFVTGILGVNLAKREGLYIFKEIQKKLSVGEMPTSELVDGLIILVGGVLLITPGVMTDIFGFSCLIPFIRKLYKSILSRVFKNKITVYSHQSRSTSGRVDADWRNIDE